MATHTPCLVSQVLSNNSVSSGVGVYWMFYSGGDYEPVTAPQGLPGVSAGAVVEGLRMRPGLAMSQVCVCVCEGGREEMSGISTICFCKG